MESQEIKNLIKLMAKIPGLGPRSARRSVLNLIKELAEYEKSLDKIAEDLENR